MQFIKKLAIAIAVGWLIGAGLFAQQMPSASMLQKDKQTIPVGVGATFIDGQLWYLVNIAPELSFGKLGVGLDLNLRYGPADSSEKKIRTEDFDEFYDYLRIIRYIRWAKKGDPFYIRLGRLDYSRLGHGFIIYNYRNSASYDLRRMGLELDIDFEKYGFESVYSDFAGRGVLGARGYARPLKFTSAGDIPVIGGLETGLTYAMDIHKDANKLYDVTKTDSTDDKGSMSVIGLDLGLPLLSLPMIRSTLYFDYAKIIGYGSGAAAGINFDFSGMGLLSISAKYERRFMGDQFIPSYFDALYERDRFAPFGSGFVSKAMALNAATKSEGYYGELLVSILNTFNIVGGYQSPVGIKNAGILHMELQTGDAIPILLLSAGYDKRNIGQIFKLDDNSVLYAQIGYKPYPYLLVSMLYEFTWTEEKDASGNVIGFKQQKRIEPKASLVFSF
ncbi:MAG: hypothetical protein HYY49_01900 [Ignavibacteriales bacterium]|nr:hypothetical protein [Ignavibacteriales bacterium]